MGRALYEASVPFRKALDEVVAHLGPELVDVMFAEEGSEEAEQLHQTGTTQPALFALEVALARLWQSWGVGPELLLGHSIGEIAAAHIAGVFCLQDACRLVEARGRLMQALPTDGAMASLQASESEVRTVLGSPGRGEVDIAAVNTPEQTVVSGEAAGVAELMEHFSGLGRNVKELKVSHAFHSPLMDPMLEEFRQVAQSIKYEMPSIPLVSSLSGQRATTEMSTGEYWVSQARHAVRFADGMQTLRSEGAGVFVELGPQPALCAMGAQCFGDQDALFLPSLRRARDDWAVLLESMASLHCNGIRLDWSAVFEPLAVNGSHCRPMRFSESVIGWTSVSKAIGGGSSTAVIHCWVAEAW